MRRKTADSNFEDSNREAASTLSSTLDSIRGRATRGTTESKAQSKREEHLFFNMHARTDGLNKRNRLVAAIQNLGGLLRKDLAVPADLHDPHVPCNAALLEDAAVGAPQSHCAFRRCTRQGNTNVHHIAHF